MPRFKFPVVFVRIQPFLSRSVEKRGDQSRFKSLGLYTNIRRSRYLASVALAVHLDRRLRPLAAEHTAALAALFAQPAWLA